MFRNMSKVFKLSVFVRKMTFLSNHTIRATRFVRTSSYYKGRLLKENEVQSVISDQPALAIVSQTKSSVMLRTHQNPTVNHVFEHIKKNQQNMDGHEALKSLLTLFTIDKQERDPRSVISTSQEFAQLCEILKKRVRELTENEVLSALKVLIHFRVSSSTVIIQILLQLMCDSVNNLSIDHILFLNFLLEKCEKTPLVDALTMASPIILRTQIKSKLMPEDVKSLINLLWYFSDEQRYDDETMSIILNAINKVEKSSIEPKNAKIMLKAIRQLNSHNMSEEILRICEEIYDDLSQIIHVNNLKEIRRNTDLGDEYNSELLDARANAVISKDVGLDIAVATLSRFNILNHTHESLLDYIVAKCVKHMEMGDEMKSEVIISLSNGLSRAHYKPQFWDKFEELSKDKLSQWCLEITPPRLLATALSLAHIDCYWPELLTKLFTNESLNEGDFLIKNRLLQLYRAVKILYPKYDGPWPSDAVLKLHESTSNVRKYYFCQSALESALGGPQYIVSNVRSWLFHIDHVAVMRRGGFPVAIKNSDESVPLSIENLHPPKNSQVLNFIYINKSGFARNTGRLTGHWSSIIRSLNVLNNHTIIPIPYDTWNESSESVKQKKISQMIRLKCNEVSLVIDS